MMPRRPRPRARRAARGRLRQPEVVIINPTDFPDIGPLGQVSADRLKRIGMNVDLAESDWGTVVQRRNNREPVDTRRLVHAAHHRRRDRLGQPGAVLPGARPGRCRAGSAGGTARARRSWRRPGCSPPTPSARRRWPANSAATRWRTCPSCRSASSGSARRSGATSPACCRARRPIRGTCGGADQRGPGRRTRHQCSASGSRGPQPGHQAARQTRLARVNHSALAVQDLPVARRGRLVRQVDAPPARCRRHPRASASGR